MPTEIEQRCRMLVQELGLGEADDVTDITPLTGGVASDIASFGLAGQRLCAKFALPKLKVAEDWHAPVHRNAAEYAWLEFAARTHPQGAVALYGRSANLHGFAMEFISGKDVYLWKTALLNETPMRNEAALVGDLLGRLQAASAMADFDARPFRNRDDFKALRIDPYLIFTASRHPDLANDLHNLATMLYEGQDVLVHGDVSPKNILFRSSGPVFLDAECATIGDASFDPAFCLNHLILKWFHLPASRAGLLGAVNAFWRAYAPHLSWEDAVALEGRVCRLLPALMLARVDGKSPVEYLSEATQGLVRAAASELLRSPAPNLQDLLDRIGRFQG